MSAEGGWRHETESASRSDHYARCMCGVLGVVVSLLRRVDDARMITLSKISFPRKCHTVGLKSRALKLLAEGLRPEVIAKLLGVNPSTVRNWRRNK